jgi:hypothetical protein
MEKYILVLLAILTGVHGTPTIQRVLFASGFRGQEHFDSAYFVPIDLYREVNDIQDKHA